MQRPGIFGIVNVTRDSFSDGGRFLTPDAACAHAEQLRLAGADVLDLGAESTHPDSEDVAADEELRRFFDDRRAAFEAAGIEPARVVFDPGMGFFLGREAGPSLTVLKHLASLAASHGPLLVSVSRKSFLGEVTGRPVAQRGAATLAAELAAARRGVGFLRTHDVAALSDALAVEAAVEGAAGA